MSKLMNLDTSSDRIRDYGYDVLPCVWMYTNVYIPTRGAAVSYPDSGQSRAYQLDDDGMRLLTFIWELE